MAEAAYGITVWSVRAADPGGAILTSGGATRIEMSADLARRRRVDTVGTIDRAIDVGDHAST